MALVAEQAAHALDFNQGLLLGDDANHDYINLPTVDNVFKESYALSLLW